MNGSVYGFGVESAYRFRFLRDGTGPPLEVVTEPQVPSPGSPCREWYDAEGLPPFARLFEDGEHRFRLWVDGAGWFSSDPARARVGIPTTGADPVVVEERAWGLPTMLCFRHRGAIPLHAAAVEVAGRAALLVGPSGSGKTTLAAACHRAGHRLLSEDLSCVRLEGAASGASVIPGPALLRLRPDVAELLGPLDGVVVAGRPDRVRVALPPERRGDCRPVPLAAVVLLQDGEDLALLPADPDRVVQDLWVSGFRFPTAAERARSFDETVGLADTVPAVVLRRPLRPDALDDAVAVLAHVVRGGAG